MPDITRLRPREVLDCFIYRGYRIDLLAAGDGFGFTVIDPDAIPVAYDDDLPDIESALSAARSAILRHQAIFGLTPSTSTTH